jgi:putative acyl-CoA dehydrogenase
MAELRLARGADRRLDAWVDGLEGELARPEEAERRARRSVERLALALEASLLVRHAPQAVADAFCASRLGDGGLSFGTLPPASDLGPILARSAPA